MLVFRMTEVGRFQEPFLYVWSALMISSFINTMMILVESGPSLSLMSTPLLEGKLFLVVGPRKQTDICHPGCI